MKQNSFTSAVKEENITMNNKEVIIIDSDSDDKDTKHIFQRTVRPKNVLKFKELCEKRKVQLNKKSDNAQSLVITQKVKFSPEINCVININANMFDSVQIKPKSKRKHKPNSRQNDRIVPNCHRSHCQSQIQCKRKNMTKMKEKKYHIKKDMHLKNKKTQEKDELVNVMKKSCLHEVEDKNLAQRRVIIIDKNSETTEAVSPSMSPVSSDNGLSYEDVSSDELISHWDCDVGSAMWK